MRVVGTDSSAEALAMKVSTIRFLVDSYESDVEVCYEMLTHGREQVVRRFDDR